MKTTLFSLKSISLDTLKNAKNNHENWDKSVEIVKNWTEKQKSGRLEQESETQQDVQFINDFFGKILGYEFENAEYWRINHKPKTDTDSSRPDATLGFYGLDKTKNDTRVVIEMKGANINLDKNQNRKDFKGSPVEQAFAYVPKLGGNCSWVIVSNFVEIRLYHASDASKYEKFELATLLEETETNFFPNLARFVHLLADTFLFTAQKDKSKTELLHQDRRAEELKISTEFYNEYHSLRVQFINELKKHNPDINALDILKTAQLILDRLLFICFARDTVDLPNVLEKILKSNENYYFDTDAENLVWLAVKNTFLSFDKGYKENIPPFNGGLFRPNELLATLQVKDLMIKPIIKFLIGYDFQSQLNVQILGHIFEQSIGDLEQLQQDLSANPQAVLSKRKIDGVFYTPEYITRYMVKNTIGTWLETAKTELLQKYNNTETADFWEAYKKILTGIKVIDPACGSGAFLVEAFNYLWQEWKIVLDESQKYTNSVVFNEGFFNKKTEKSRNYWQAKRDIVKNNLFGVDLNPQSVEISRLALWLLTANRDVSLCDLSQNILHGNSLVNDPEISEAAFDWAQHFDFQFDVVIGNPPYGAKLDKAQTDYLKKEYKTAEYQIETYQLFYEKGLDILAKNGLLGFITPAGFTYQEYAKELRAIFSRFSIENISKQNYKVFKDASTGDTVSWIVKNCPQAEYVQFRETLSEKDEREKITLPFSFQHFKPNNTYVLSSAMLQNYNSINIDNCELLGDICDIVVGIKAYEEGQGKPKQSREIVETKPFTADRKIDADYQICLNGKNFNRYQFNNPNPVYLKYGEWLAAPRPSAPFFEAEKIILRQTADRLICTLDTAQHINFNNVYNIARPKEGFLLKYILAILNSELMDIYYQTLAPERGKLFAEVKKIYLEKLPIKKIPESEQLWYVERVDKLLELYAKRYKSSRMIENTVKQNFPKFEGFGRYLEKWYDSVFSQLIQELEKQKVVIPLKKQNEWEQFFTEEKATTQQTTAEIEAIEAAINAAVKQLYK